MNIQLIRFSEDMRMVKIAQRQRDFAEELWNKFSGIGPCPGKRPEGYTGLEQGLVSRMLQNRDK